MKKIIKSILLISWISSFPLSVISCSSNNLSKSQLENYTLNALNQYWTNTDPIFKPNSSLTIKNFKTVSFKEHQISKNNKIYYDINFNIHISNLTAFKYINTAKKISLSGADTTGEFQINLKQPKNFNWLDNKKPTLVYNLKNFNHVIDTTYNLFMGNTNDFIMVFDSSNYDDWYKATLNHETNKYLKAHNLNNLNISLKNNEWVHIAKSNKLDNFSSSNSYYAAIHVVNKQVIYSNMNSDSTYHEFPAYKISSYVPLISFQDPNNNNKHLFLNKDILNKLNVLYHASLSKQGLNNWNFSYINNYLKEYNFEKSKNTSYSDIAKCLINFIQSQQSNLNTFLNINQTDRYHGIWIQFNSENDYLSSEINSNNQNNN